MESIIETTKIRKALATYDPDGARYLLNLFIPAQVFSMTFRMKMWGSRHVKDFEEICQNRDKRCFTTYAICFNGTKVYEGSSIKPYARFLCHLYEIYNNAFLWGLSYSSLDDPSFLISFEVADRAIYNKNERIRAEVEKIKKDRPLLMLADGTDHLIPFKDRRRVIRAAGIK
ncbi:MAG: hypothetical protein J5778_08395 [Clostridiales bacterium]|nr:hypothetical protein [Clostridiales bacterium]